MRILGISGSLKSTSTTAGLLRAAAALSPAGTAWSFLDRHFGELPHFNPDLDEEGAVAPPAVAAWRRALAGCDAVLAACPEYAHGVPGSFKNAIDWIVSSGELHAKPVALLMASPTGARHAWAALAPTLRMLEADLVFEASLVFARRGLDENGRLVDEAQEAEVKRALVALASAVAARQG